MPLMSYTATRPNYEVSIFDGPKGTWVIQLCDSKGCRKFVTQVPTTEKEQDKLVKEVINKLKNGELK